MEELYRILLFIIIVVLFVMYYKNKKASIPTNQPTLVTLSEDKVIETSEQLPYKKKLLLTKNEWSFYKSLKPVAEKL